METNVTETRKHISRERNEGMHTIMNNDRALAAKEYSVSGLIRLSLIESSVTIPTLPSPQYPPNQPPAAL